MLAERLKALDIDPAEFGLKAKLHQIVKYTDKPVTLCTSKFIE